MKQASIFWYEVTANWTTGPVVVFQSSKHEDCANFVDEKASRVEKEGSPFYGYTISIQRQTGNLQEE